jgi:D-hexose-6-phosphate mutarotase
MLLFSDAHAMLLSIVQLAAKNNSEQVMKTTQALHTYYRVSNVANVCVTGLEGVSYLDNTDQRRVKAGAEGPTSVDQFVDRIYQSNGTMPLRIVDQFVDRIYQSNGMMPLGIVDQFVDRWVGTDQRRVSGGERLH